MIEHKQTAIETSWSDSILNIRPPPPLIIHLEASLLRLIQINENNYCYLGDIAFLLIVQDI